MPYIGNPPRVIWVLGMGRGGGHALPSPDLSRRSERRAHCRAVHVALKLREAPLIGEDVDMHAEQIHREARRHAFAFGGQMADPCHSAQGDRVVRVRPAQMNCAYGACVTKLKASCRGVPSPENCAAATSV